MVVFLLKILLHYLFGAAPKKTEYLAQKLKLPSHKMNLHSIPIDGAKQVGDFLLKFLNPVPMNVLCTLRKRVHIFLNWENEYLMF